MNPITPPAWMERLLELFLSVRDRDTVPGDLYEEFRVTKVPELGAFRAKLWYLRQVVSFAPRQFGSLFVHPRALALLCAFTALCGAWLGAMDLRLHHPRAQVAIAAIIVSQALLTLCALRYSMSLLLRALAMLGCCGLFWLAAKALAGLLHGADFEGYILLIALGLLVQALLTLGTLPQLGSPRRPAS